MVFKASIICHSLKHWGRICCGSWGRKGNQVDEEHLDRVWLSPFLFINTLHWQQVWDWCVKESWTPWMDKARLYWLRDAVQESLISPVYVPTQQNIADLFTKAVQPQVIQFAVPKLGLRPWMFFSLIGLSLLCLFSGLARSRGCVRCALDSPSVISWWLIM